MSNDELLDQALNVIRRLLRTEYAEDCQECGIGQRKAWRDARKLVKRIDQAEQAAERLAKSIPARGSQY